MKLMMSLIIILIISFTIAGLITSILCAYFKEIESDDIFKSIIIILIGSIIYFSLEFIIFEKIPENSITTEYNIDLNN